MPIHIILTRHQNDSLGIRSVSKICDRAKVTTAYTGIGYKSWHGLLFHTLPVAKRLTPSSLFVDDDDEEELYQLASVAGISSLVYQPTYTL